MLVPAEAIPLAAPSMRCGCNPMAITISILENLTGGAVRLRREDNIITVEVTSIGGDKAAQTFGIVQRTATSWRFIANDWPCPAITGRTARDVAASAWQAWQRTYPEWRTQFEAPSHPVSDDNRELFERGRKAADLS